MPSESRGIGPPVVAALLLAVAVSMVLNPLETARLLGHIDQPGHDLDGLVGFAYGIGLGVVSLGIFAAWLVPVSGTTHPRRAGVIPAACGVLGVALYAVGPLVGVPPAIRFVVGGGAIVFACVLLVAWWWGPLVRVVMQRTGLVGP